MSPYRTLPRRAGERLRAWPDLDAEIVVVLVCLPVVVAGALRGSFGVTETLAMLALIGVARALLAAAREHAGARRRAALDLTRPPSADSPPPSP